MGIVKTKGIIIAESNMGDFDKMLTILTPGMGKIACAAKGARRQTSSLLAGTQLAQVMGEFSGTTSTQRVGLEVALEY